MTTKLARLKEHARVTQGVYDDYWRFVMNSGDPINWNVMESLANRANLAQNDVHNEEGFPITFEEWKDSMTRFRECTCQPHQDAYLCPVCKEYTDKKYGDSIPFGGE